jgi:hypothetical protein
MTQMSLFQTVSEYTVRATMGGVDLEKIVMPRGSTYSDAIELVQHIAGVWKYSFGLETSQFLGDTLTGITRNGQVVYITVLEKTSYEDNEGNAL